jgi:hypothetical protein
MFDGSKFQGEAVAEFFNEIGATLPLTAASAKVGSPPT